MITYNPKKWYWIGPLGLYSGSESGIISPSDADYVAWLANGNIATPWPKDASGVQTAASLDEVLVAADLSPTGLATPSKAELLTYANAKQWTLATGGHAVTVGGASHVFATDPTSLTMMGGKVARLAQPSPPASFNWQAPDGAWLTIAAGDFPAVATACADFVQATFDALKTVETEIASDAISTFTQIDSYAWPV